jgi:hypothetical protein
MYQVTPLAPNYFCASPVQFAELCVLQYNLYKIGTSSSRCRSPDSTTYELQNL